MAAHYAIAYPGRVSQLILLSPVGLAPASIGPGVQVTAKISLADRIIGAIWARYHITPLQMARCAGPLLPSIIRSFVKESTLFRTVIDKRQISASSRYVYGVVRSRSSADVLMCHIVGECAFGEFRFAEKARNACCFIRRGRAICHSGAFISE